jgi:hypothetical protein
VPGNGQRRPPRPRIAVTSPSASPQEAAAIAAAIERFIAETRAATPAPERPQSRWQRVALLEAVGAKSALGSPWGGRLV